MWRTLWILLAIAVVSSSCGNEDVTLGDRLFDQGKYDDAIKAYTEYLELQPTHLKSIYNRGRAYEELGKYDQALSDFEKTLEIDQKNVSALLSIGNHYYRKERFDIAAYNFEKAVGLNTNLAEARYLWGKAQHQLGKFDDALFQYNLAISLNSNYGDAYFHRGVLNISMKNSKKACQDLRTAKTLNVADADAALSKYCR